MGQHVTIRKRDEFLVEVNRHLGTTADTDRGTGVVMACVANISELNQLHGYPAGDRAIAHCAKILDQVARTTDSVMRIGDASFAMALQGLVSRAQLMLALQKIVRLARKPGAHTNGPVAPRLCIGATLGEDPDCDPQELLLESERALAEASESGSDFAIFSREDDKDDRWDIEAELRDALASGHMEIRYQPKIDLRSARTAGAEALIRWPHQTRGSVSPELFVPLAEKCGLIDSLTWAVINTSLEQLSQAGESLAKIPLSINVSPAVLRSHDFLDALLQSATLWNRPPEYIALEITETAVMSDPEVTHGLLREARALGFKISIDDFGSGYSSFGYFKNLPADEVKIDKQFVLGMASDPADRHIVEAVIDLAHRFDFTVVAEGVEDPETATLLRAMGCDVGQGYFFLKPACYDDFVAYVAQSK